MAFSRTAKSRRNSNITKKISYIKMPNRVKIVELFKEPLFIVYRGKKIYYWLKFRGLATYKKLKVNLKYPIYYILLWIVYI